MIGENGMYRKIQPLTEDQINSTTPGKKPLKLFDGDGLYLLVEPTGGKLWRFKYRFAGKEKLISFGAYPDVSLSDARIKRNEARLLLNDEIDPSAARKEEKACLKAAEAEVSKGCLSLRAVMDGTFELRKGRIVFRLTREEAQFVADLLNKLLQ
jgi:hypothetical protein